MKLGGHPTDHPLHSISFVLHPQPNCLFSVPSASGLEVDLSWRGDRSSFSQGTVQRSSRMWAWTTAVPVSVTRRRSSD